MVILAVTLGVIFSICLLIFVDDNGGFSVGVFFAAFAIAFLVSVLVLAMMVAISPALSNVVHEERIEIYSLFNDPVTSGSFFLASGSISQKDLVYYWRLNENGAYIKEYVPMDESEFLEDQTSDGYLVIHSLQCSDEYDDSGWSKWALCNESIDRYTFHIPKDSIYYGFNLK